MERWIGKGRGRRDDDDDDDDEDDEDVVEAGAEVESRCSASAASAASITQAISVCIAAAISPHANSSDASIWNCSTLRGLASDDDDDDDDTVECSVSRMRRSFATPFVATSSWFLKPSTESLATRSRAEGGGSCCSCCRCSAVGRRSEEEEEEEDVGERVIGVLKPASEFSVIALEESD